MKTDHEKLQGAWNVVALELDGKKMLKNMFAGSQILIQGEQFDTVSMGVTYRGTVKLDALSKPKHFDLIFTEGPEKGNTNLGIYELKGDTWKLCLDTTGKQRPKKFATKPASGHALEILKRAPLVAKKSFLKDAGAAANASKRSKRVGGLVTELEGEWSMISGVMNGSPMDESIVKWVKRVTGGNETKVIAGPQVMLQVEFTSDSSASPKTIDYLNTAGANKGQTQLGIYELDGATLKVCVSAPGQQRPAEFASRPGDGRTFTVWSFAKK